MDLIKLQQKQRQLDNEIIKGTDINLHELLIKRTIALDIELGEMLNDHQGFKYWKKNNAPKESLLEECADVLHFYLSIANLCDIELPLIDDEIYKDKTVYNHDANVQYIYVKKYLAKFISIETTETKIETTTAVYKRQVNRPLQCNINLILSFITFINLVTKHFGFTLEVMEKEYHRKHQINYDRIKNGY